MNILVTQGMHVSCLVTKASDTHSEYVILISFLWQQWLHEHASVLCFMYIACLVVLNITDVLLHR
jgi:hypothetical protein